MENIQLNSLGQQILLARDKAKYDAYARSLASYKPVLARILKHCCIEFGNLDEEEIMKRITGVSTASEEDPDLKAAVLFNETEIPDEGKAVFDLHFLALAPGKDGNADYWIEVNLELNKGIPYKYHVLNRGIFNSARMISGQGERIIRHMDYDRMIPVYSIFIIFDVPQKYGNLTCGAELLFFQYYDNGMKSNGCDKLNVRAVCIPKDYENSKAVNQQTMLTGALRVLFSDKIKPKYKIPLLQNKYGIITTERMRKEINQMCNLSDAIEARGIAAGRREGIAVGKKEGITEGEAKSRKEIALNMLAADMPVESVQKFTGLTLKQINALKN